MISQWLNYFHQKSLQQDQQTFQQQQQITRQNQVISNLKSEIQILPKKEDIKRIIDETIAYEEMITRLDSIERRMMQAAQGQPSTQSQIQPPTTLQPQSQITPTQPSNEMLEMQKRLEKLEQRKSNLKEKLIKRITKNSKDYVKSIVLSLIKKYEKIPALQLKEMVVEEQGLCSKSSFYRLLEEIEAREDIGVIRTGKEKHYIAKLSKQT
jgi:hypothetical protein